MSGTIMDLVNAGVTRVVMPPEPQKPRSEFFPLFEHMSREHGLTLTDSELYEIVRVVESMAVGGEGRKPGRSRVRKLYPLQPWAGESTAPVGGKEGK